MTSIRPDGRVEFRFFRPNAVQVKVLGSFNGWAGDSLMMEPQGDGWWIAETDLSAGDYRFRYWADGEWYTDFASHGVESTKHGWNGVLVVPEPMRSTMKIGRAEERNRVRTITRTMAKSAA